MRRTGAMAFSRKVKKGFVAVFILRFLCIVVVNS
nr:MAG TPA: hypothetical protein [Caudoviricetes sp.]